MPPYSTPIEVVAETSPAFVWRGPLREPKVRALLKVFAPVNIFAVYVFGIVDEAWINDCTREST